MVIFAYLDDLLNDRAFRNGLALLIEYFKPNWVLTRDPRCLHQFHIVPREKYSLSPQMAIGLAPHSPLGIYFFRTSNPDHFEDITDYID